MILLSVWARRLEIPPTPSSPFKYICKNFRLLDGIINCVMGVLVPRPKRRIKAGSACLRNGNTCLNCKCSFYIEAARVIKGRHSLCKSNKLPIEPSPIKAQRVCNQNRFSCSSNLLDPFASVSHRNFGKHSLQNEPRPIQTVDSECLFLKAVRDWPELNIKTSII